MPDVGRIHVICSNVRGLAGNSSDMTVASSWYDISLASSETLDSDMRHVSELLVHGFGRHVWLSWGWMSRARGMAAYVWDGYGAFHQIKFGCGCCEMFFRVRGARQNFYVFSLYRNSALDNQIFNCLLISVWQFDSKFDKFDSKLIFEDQVRVNVSHICQIIGILRLVKHVFVDTSVLLRGYYAFVLQMLEYWLFSSVGISCWMSSSASRAPGVFNG